MALWMVRAGKDGEREEFALQHGVAVIGWGELPDLSQVRSRKELRQLYETTYPHEKPNAVAIWVGQVWTFVSRISIDDLIILPLKSHDTIAIGRVTGPYRYRPDFPSDALHTHEVVWAQTGFPRIALDEEIRKSLNAAMTVCQIQKNDAEQRVRQLLQHNKAWIFQANPNTYDVQSAVKSLKEDTWLVRRYGKEIKMGDRVYLWESGSVGGIVGVAEVLEEVQVRTNAASEDAFVKRPGHFEGEQPRVLLRIVRSVDPIISRQEIQANPKLAGLSIFRQPQGTNFAVSNEEAEEIERLLGSSPIPPTLAELAKISHLDTAELEEIESLLSGKKQLILEGPPGSGKTYVGELFARYFTGNPLMGEHDDRLTLVQFHQSYGYEDFIQGIRPETNPETHQIEYHIRDGIFKRLCDVARSNPDKRFVIVVDEINRGNISRIFGELLLLLEYRDKEVVLPYANKEDKPFSIPGNVYIIGTMNTTDRSLAQIDYALRRRFYFYRLMPVVDGAAPVLQRWLQEQDATPEECARVVRLFLNLNDKVRRRLDEHYQVGHSYFMQPDIGTEIGLRRVWRHAVLPLLEEYFHNQRDRATLLDEFTIERLDAEVVDNAAERQ